MFKIQDLKLKLVNNIQKSISEVQTKEGKKDQSLSEVFQKLKDVFEPSKARSFSGLIQFLISGAEPQAIMIGEDHTTVTIEEIKGATPALTIRTDKDTALSFLTGKINTTEALMKGKIKVDHTNLLLRFQKMFDFKKLDTMLSSSKDSDPELGMNRDYIGKWFTGTAEHVKPDHVKLFAKATNETNPKYYIDDPTTLKIPALYPVVFLHDLLGSILLDPELRINFLRLVHAEQEIIYFRPLKAWDLVYPVAEITKIETKSSGEIITVKVNGRVSGLDIFEMRVTNFIRGQSRIKGKSKSKVTTIADPRKPDFTHTMKITSDQTERYAKASGDTNPIHLDEDTAIAAGLPGRILHGLCTMAFTSQAIVDKLLNGDVYQLKRIKVRFSSPVFLDDVLTTVGWLKKENGRKIVSFETTTAKGVKVITNGEAELV